jgi:gliding motility-associated-like protein
MGKHVMAFLICFLLINKTKAQTTIWSETFDPAPQAGWIYNSPFGLNDPDSNFWDVSDLESGMPVGVCGNAGQGNQTLHVTNTLFGGGATYNAGGLCTAVGICVISNNRASTPLISTLGFTGPITLSFSYIEGGQGSIDDFVLQYSVNGGGTWLVLNNPAKTINTGCSGQGLWTAYSIGLPASCNNISNLKIGFSWKNNDDAVGTDPSVAINDILLTVPAAALNTKPIAVNDTIITNCNTLGSKLVMSNDSDPDLGQTIGLTSLFNVGTQGSTGISGNAVTFFPNSNFFGTTSFSYIICDNGVPSLCDTGLITVIVNNVNCNLPPIANPDTVSTCGAAVNIAASNNDTDPDAGQFLNIGSLILTGTQGSAILVGNNIIFTPTPGFSGTTTFSYSVCDNGPGTYCDTALVTIYVAGTTCNDAPIANTDTIISICNQPASLNVISNDTDPNANSINLGAFGAAGTVIGSLNYAGTNITYTPGAGSPTIQIYSYTICDNGLPVKCDTGIIYLINAGCNQPPIAVNDFYLTACNTNVVLSPLANDTDPNFGQILTYSITSSPAHGSITAAGINILAYSPATCFNGMDTVFYQVCDNGSPSLCDTGRIIINVAACICNTPPNATVDIVNTNCNTKLIIDAKANDTDPDLGQQLALSQLVKPASHGISIINFAANKIEYTPANCFSGLDTILYRVCDTGTPSQCDTGMVIITVGACACVPPVAAFAANKTEICAGDCIILTDASNNLPTSYAWTIVGATPGTSTDKNPIVCFPNEGLYSVTLIATNIYGASIPETKQSYIKVNATPGLQTFNYVDTIGRLMQPNAQTGNIISFKWTPSAGLSADDIANPVFTLTGNTTYICQVVNNNGCKGEYIFNYVGVKAAALRNVLLIPNAFSPNGDNLNDTWLIKHRNIAQYKVVVVNRWGNVVFTSTEPNQGWNGTQRGTDRTTETYFYYIKAICEDGEVMEKRGDVEVIY